MAPLSKDRQFEIITSVLALAEERSGGVSLDDAADSVGLTPAQVKELLEPVLFLEYRDAAGEIIDESRAFLLTEDQRVTVTEDHWLRSLASEPPGADAALRLSIAATVMAALSPTPPPDLESALRKLEALLATEIVIPFEHPEHLATCQQARREAKTLDVRYTNEQGETRDRTIEPWQVFSNWGKWYIHGRDTVETDPKWFRIDRIQAAEIGTDDFDAPDDLEIPDWFDLTEHDLTVRLRLDPAALDTLPTPHRLGPMDRLPDGRVEVDVTVAGPRRRDHLLLAAGPDAEVVAPPECRGLRREHAREILALYEAG